MRASREAEYTEYVQARLGWLRRTAYLLCQDWQGADDLAQKAITRLYTHWGRAGRPPAWMPMSGESWSRRSWMSGGPRGRAASPFLVSMKSVRPLATTPRCGWMSGPRCGRCRRGSGPPSCCATTATALSRRRQKILGVTPGTVKSQTAKGLTALRLALAPVMEA